MATRHVVGNRPKEAPEGWIIQNAPRPLWGHKDWVSDFVCGVFFVAINPDKEDASEMIQRNRENGAVKLVYTPERQAIEESLNYYAAKHPAIYKSLDPTDPDTRKKLILTWIDRANKEETTV